MQRKVSQKQDINQNVPPASMKRLSMPVYTPEQMELLKQQHQAPVNYQNVENKLNIKGFSTTGALMSNPENQEKQPNFQHQQMTCRKNLEKQQKLFNNLESLTQASNNLSEGLKQQQQEVEAKQKQVEIKQQDLARQLEGKLLKTINVKDSIKSELEEKRVKLREVEENAVKTKQEILTVKELQERLVKELADQTDQKLNEITQRCKNITDEIEDIKGKIKDEKKKKRNLEEKIEIQEDARMILSTKLNDLGKEIQNSKNLDHTTADFDNEVQQNQRLADKIKTLKELKNQAQNQNKDIYAQQRELANKVQELKILANSNQDSTQKRKAMLKKRDDLKAQNKEYFDTNLKLLNQLQQCQAENQLSETKRLELVEVANLLKDQNKFEKLSRTLQTRIEDMEDQQRIQENTLKEVTTNMKVILTETESDSQAIQSMLKDFQQALEKSISSKDELKESLRQVMIQVCNKPPSELKIDMIDEHFKSLEKHEEMIADAEDNQWGIDRKQLDLRKTYFQFEKKLKHTVFDENEDLMIANEKGIHKLLDDHKQLNERLTKLDNQVLEKVSSTTGQMQAIEMVRQQVAKAKAHNRQLKTDLEQEKLSLKEIKESHDSNKHKLGELFSEKASLDNNNTNIGEFTAVLRDSEDQKKRLEDMGIIQVRNLEEELSKILIEVAKIEQDQQGDKIENAHRQIDDARKKADDFESDIQKLEEKLRVLKTNAAKANPDDEKEVNDEIASIQKNLDKIRLLKDNMLKELDNLQKAQGGDLIENQKTINEIFAKLDNLQNKELKEKEKDIDAVEMKLRQAIRDKRIECRKECQENIDKCKLDASELSKLIDKIKYKIDSVSRDSQQLDKSFSYKDQEREKQCQDQLTDPLEEKRKILSKLQVEKDGLVDFSQKLNIEFEQLTAKLVGVPTVFAQKVKEGEDSQIDEAIYQWKQTTAKVKENNIILQRTLDRANQQYDQVETLGQIFNEMMEKFKNKSQLYKDCQLKQKSKQDIINRQKENFNIVARKLQNIDASIKKVILPPENNDNTSQFFKDYYEAQNELAKNQEILQKQLLKRDQLQAELNSICSNLPFIGEKIILTKELQNMKDDLDKLDFEATYLNDEIKALDFDIENLNNALQLVIAQNKKLLADQDEVALSMLENNFGELDKVHQETVDKMKQYNSKIKDGLWTEDQDLRRQLKLLQDEAEALERDLKQKERLKANLKQQDKQNKEIFNQLKMNPKKSPIEDFQTIGQNFQNIDEQAKTLTGELEQIKIELDKRIKELDDYMSKYNDLLGLYSEFDNMVGDIKKNFKGFQQKIIDSKDMITNIEQVLKEMNLGVARDYKLKENFIKQEQDELEDVRRTLKRLDEMVATTFKPRIKDMQTKGNQQLDTDELQTVMTQAQEILEELESADNMASSCVQRLKQIKTDISDADVPELTKEREKEIVEFSSKLRQAEQDVYDIRKQLQTTKGVENFKEVDQELKEIESKIQQFKQDRQNYKRILGQELIIYLPQPKALEDYPTLKTVIGKLRNLGNSLQQSIQGITDIDVALQKIKREIGGLDLMKRYEQQKKIEDDQRKRLENIKTRLDRIEKGAQDCDGYTSNTEEATFIETLLGELPEMMQKQIEASEECDTILDQLDTCKRDIVKASAQDGTADEQAAIIASTKLDDIEDQTGLNEKTVVFLEKLVDKLEDHFMSMDVKKKLDKRQMELNELSNICTDFEEQLTDMQEHIVKDLEKIDEKKKGGPAALQEMLVDEAGNPINLLEEVNQVSQELKEILLGVTDLQDRNKEIQQKRDEAQHDFNEQILKKSPYKSHTKITNKHDVFSLIRANGWIKKRIVEMIKSLKDVSKKMRDYKSKYSTVRNKIEKQNRPKKLYRAIKGDLVDEMFADYINKLNCPVPIKRLGNNQYTFGTKKIFAKIINGKLVIRVGGGYMGIEEFMMYYGQQELTRIQKEEMLKSEENDEIFAGIDIASDSDEIQEADSKNMEHVDIETLKRRISQQSAKKKTAAEKSMIADDKEEQKDEKALVVGLGDVRKALRKNLVEIKTYDEHSSVGTYKGSSKGSKKVDSETNLVERQLKMMEKNIESKLNKQQEKDISAKKMVKKNITTKTSMNSFKPQKVIDHSTDQGIDDDNPSNPSTKRQFGSSRIPPMRKSQQTPMSKNTTSDQK